MAEHIPSADELPIDWCPKCGLPLADYKITTRVNHDKIYHKRINWKKTAQKIKSNPKALAKFFGAIFAFILFVTFFHLVTDPINPYTTCSDVVNRLNTEVKDKGMDDYFYNLANQYHKDCWFILQYNMTNNELDQNINSTFIGNLTNAEKPFVYYSNSHFFLKNYTKSTIWDIGNMTNQLNLTKK